jgi:putative transposase
MATRKRHSPEQIVRKLMAADRLLAEGKDTAAVCRELGVSDATYHRWRNQFGGLKAEDAKRLKDLERENSTLERLPRRSERRSTWEFDAESSYIPLQQTEFGELGAVFVEPLLFMAGLGKDQSCLRGVLSRGFL